MEDKLRGAGERDRLAPLIEMTFRATYVMATKMREEMLEAGRADELDELVSAARALQDEVLSDASKSLLQGPGTCLQVPETLRRFTGGIVTILREKLHLGIACTRAVPPPAV